MPRQNKAGAISVLFTGLLVLVVLLASADVRVSANARLQGATVTLTPCDDDLDDGSCSDYRDDLTLTAELATQTATALGTSSAGTPTPSAGTPTVTPTPQLSPTSSAGAVTPAATAALPTSIAPSQPVAPSQELLPTETPTAVPEDALTCYPGQPLVLSGDGPPRAPFLVYFGQRAVSGGSVAQSGRFSTTLMIGHERAGAYPVVVRVRGTSQVLLEVTCAVPDVTPTLVPRARDLP